MTSFGTKRRDAAAVFEKAATQQELHVPKYLRDLPALIRDSVSLELDGQVTAGVDT